MNPLGPLHTTSAEVFDDFDDDHGQNLLGSLHLDTEEEPVRRGASRANSVRFDVSAIQGSNWAQSSRTSGDFGPLRPNSGFGGHPLERTFSHKSDGRHSSAGHSIHSVHSVPSGRTSSLGLDTNFMIGGQDDGSPFETPEPPPGLSILGSVPCIIRCWLNENFSHGALLYADVCTGSHKSTLEYGLIKELGFGNRIQKGAQGVSTIRLPVYLPEAVVTQPASRANSPAPQLPALTVSFEVTNIHQRSTPERKKAIRIFLGSDTLRAHSADLLLSQNSMTLYGDGRNKLLVPFVRPEDDSVFKNLCTTNIVPEKIGLKGTALPFTPADRRAKFSLPSGYEEDNEVGPTTPSEDIHQSSPNVVTSSAGIASHVSGAGNGNLSDNHKESSPTMNPLSVGGHSGSSLGYSSANDIRTKDNKLNKQDSKPAANWDTGAREYIGVRWGSWRNGGLPGSDGEAAKDSVSTSSYNRPGRGGKSMKVLKPSKTIQNGRSASGSHHIYEPQPHSPLEDGQPRRKSQISLSDSNPSSWEPKGSVSRDKAHKEIRPSASVPRSSNPIGGASAFAWMKPSNIKADVTTTE